MHASEDEVRILDSMKTIIVIADQLVPRIDNMVPSLIRKADGHAIDGVDDIHNQPDLRYIITTAKSAGLMPLMRLAWPRLVGRTRLNFSLASARSCGTAA
jgi:hypothetical protein